MNQQELEMLFIGSILASPDNLATSDLSPTDMVTDAGLRCFQAAVSIFKERKPVNIQTVAHIAGMKYGSWLAESSDVGISVNFKYLMAEIKNRATQRRIKAKLKEAIRTVDTIHSSETMEELRKIYSQELSQGHESGTIHEAMSEFEAMSAKYRDAGSIGITTGFGKWDDQLITYEPGHLWAIGGFTSVGKTATALEFVGRIGHNKGTAVFSMEMTKPQIISRMLSRITGYSSRRILAGQVNDTALTRAKEYLSSQPLYIFRKTRDWGKIANACRVLKMQGHLDVAVFDYQQNIGAEGKSTHDKMESISRGAQDLCQDLEITGVMLSQISLQQNRDDSGSPEFKGGGGLAECADVALHLSRPRNSKTNLLIEMRKNRHGPKIDMLLDYQDYFTRLEEIG
jgi:replicative DNA helicase